MIILPDRSTPKTRILLPVHHREWRTPSEAQLKDEFGNENKTLFRIRAKLNDGFVKWTGWFEDREDFDAFLWGIASGSLVYERELWKLPNNEWYPDIGENLSYDFATITYLTSPLDTDQTYNRPSDWNVTNNFVEVLGGGGGGARGAGSVAGRGGAGGGAYSKQTNIVIGLTANYRIGSAGSGATTNNTSGGSGQDSWFNGATLAASSVGAKGGSGSTSQSGAAGGLASSGVGLTKFNGGTGGTGTGGNGPGGGGGGAAGGSAVGGTGGNGGGGIGGTGGAGNGGLSGGGSGSSTGATGGTGTNLGGGYGSGGGGGGGGGSPTAGGLGGLYGAGGGGGGTSSNNGAADGGSGRQGLILISYEPYNYRSLHNSPMLGL